MKLTDFLDAKPLYYDEIDYDRMPRTYAAIKEQLQLPKVIHVVGTNGKGTTGRFIANALWRAGFSVGHYTSPHILRFNERIWLNGENVSDDLLDAAHETLFTMLGQARADALSYFEYTTLLAMVVYRECDWVVLEAGLGGEHDATNVFEKTLSVFTPIDYDHQAFLGNEIDEIAATKLRSMGPKAIIGEQPHASVYAVYDKIAAEKGAQQGRVKEILSDADMVRVHQIAAAQGLPAYLESNMGLAAAALKVAGVGFEPEWFVGVALFGRMSRISDNVTIDVGHNPLAAEAIYRSIYPQKVVLVYNTYRDKAYDAILKILKPVIKRVEIIDVNEARIVEREALEAALREAEIAYGAFKGIEATESYLVFGSFSVVEAFLKEYHA
jgi:dihydrofolate synthase/folylpolyglutamate synthase